MKLIATDQLHVSSVKPDSLRPGEAFEVSETFGAELLAKHPTRVRLAAGEAEAKAEDPPTNKAEPPPANKAEGAPKKRSAAKA